VSSGRAGRLALALCSTVVALGVCEAYLRIAGPERASDLRGLHEPRPDKPWLYGLRPGARGTLPVSGDVLYEINGEGFRDRLHARPKPAGTFRILVLGDSVSFGYGVAADDVYPARMEALLGGGFEVLNFGVGGYNPYNEAALLRDVGASYEPDLVLVQFCNNDLSDPTLHFDAQTRLRLGTIPAAAYPDPGAAAPPTAGWRRTALSLCRSLRVCALVDDALLRRNAASPDDGARLDALRSHQAIPPGPARAWLAGLYGEMAGFAADHGAGFAVAIFPFEAQVVGSAGHRLQAELVDLGRAGGWQAVDLLPAFAAARADGEGPLFLDVWHLSAAGHRVAARALVAELRRRALLPAPDV
jgi:lysophospholipase L1-like esterase